MVELKILHADTDDIENPLRGGQPYRTCEVNSRLIKSHDVTVFTANYKGALRSVNRNGIQYKRIGFTVPKWGLSSHLTYLAGLGFAVRSEPHDLVVEEYMPPFGFSMLPLWTDKPVV